MQDVIVTAATNLTDLTLDLTAYGLTGDTSGDIEITGDLIYPASAGGPGYYVRPFGANDTNLESYYSVINASVAQAASTAANWFLANCSGTADVHINIYVYLTTKSGRPRACWMRSQPVAAPSASGFANVISAGFTTDMSTVIDAITVHSSVSGAIKAGSYMKARFLKNTL